MPPGGEGKVTLRLDMKGFQGVVKKTATVQTDASSESRFVLTVKGKVKAIIEVQPEKTVYFQGMADMLREKNIDVVSSLRTFHIVRTKETNLTGKASYNLETVEDGKHYRLKVSNTTEAGTYRGFITLYTDLSEKPEVTVWVSGFVEGEIGIRPNSLVLGRLAAEQPVLSGRVSVMNNRKQPFRITKLTFDEKLIRVKQDPAPEGSGFLLEIAPKMGGVKKGGRAETVLG
ncbi:MAG: hypothetical protein LLG06_08030, partial [Desulfobacteraceae bacterium]|nr:hypothetical protein [Desulfobacteraceae bacterium]